MSSLPFKRLAVGKTFSYKGLRYRKASTKGAYVLQPSGRGVTHAEVPFARSTSVDT